MAKQRARRSRVRRLSAVLAALGVVLAVVGSPEAANATIWHKSISPSNADLKAKCSLDVQSVDPVTYETKIKLAAQAQPASFAGYGQNVFTQVDCYILPAGDTNPADALAEIHPNGNTAVLLTTSTMVTLAFADSYTLCGRGWVKLKNGDTSYTPYICA